jgi:hypothetical protein
MIEEYITQLRRRMIEDMSIRHFASKTQHDYIRTVMNLTRFLAQSPDVIGCPLRKRVKGMINLAATAIALK